MNASCDFVRGTGIDNEKEKRFMEIPNKNTDDKRNQPGPRRSSPPKRRVHATVVLAAPGLPPHFPNPQALITEDCIRPPEI